ncbi:MAG: DEAD/DEAH box helicase [Prevotella sp.]|nr:DEAD/DEAH box helicase [Prevotella sp.]
MDIRQKLIKLGISELADMQKEASDVLLNTKKDVIILSPTGSGKTLAYLLPLVESIDGTKDCIQAIVIVPGRELALQSANVLKELGSGIRCMALYGGRPTMDEHRKLRELRPHVVFATPGRLNDHIDKQNFSVDDVRWLIIDEFDKCLEMGFRDEMQRVVERLPRLSRRVLLSATDVKEIDRWASAFMSNATVINYLLQKSDDDSQEAQLMIGNGRCSMYTVDSPDKDKLETLSKLLRSFGQQSSIVFLNYRESVERTDEYLRKQGFATSAFHGGLEQKQREDALYKFSNGSANILVSTDLASRGLDIPNIANIVHYHLPESEEGYIHRVGRTARWDAQGRAFFILHSGEEVPSYVNETTEEYVIPDQLPWPAEPLMATIYIGKGKKDKISKGDIVGFLCKKGGLESSDIGRIDVNDRYCYAAITKKKVRQVLEKVKGEKVKGVKTIVEVVE